MFLRLMPGMPLLLILKRFLVKLVILTSISLLLMSLSPLTPLIEIFLTVPLVNLVSLPGFVRCISLSIVMFVFGLSLLLVLGLLGSEMEPFLRDAPSVWSSLLHYMLLGAAIWSLRLVSLLNFMLITSSALLIMLILS